MSLQSETRLLVRRYLTSQCTSWVIRYYLTSFTYMPHRRYPPVDICLFASEVSFMLYSILELHYDN